MGVYLLGRGHYQPPEVTLSILCESFGIMPEQAEEIDPSLALPIMEYRLANAAKEEMNRNGKNMTQPMAELMNEIAEAMAEDR